MPIGAVRGDGIGQGELGKAVVDKEIEDQQFDVPDVHLPQIINRGAVVRTDRAQAKIRREVLPLHR